MGKRKHRNNENQVNAEENTVLIVNESQPEVVAKAEALVEGEGPLLTEAITKPEPVNETPKTVAVNSSNSWDLDPVAIKGGVNAKTKEQVEDNPFGKKVKTVIEKVTHNVNDERMTDSELISNVTLL